MLPIFLDAEDTRTFLLYFLRLGEIGMHDSKVAGTRKYFPLKDGSALGGRKYQRYIPAAMLVISVLWTPRTQSFFGFSIVSVLECL